MLSSLVDAKTTIRTARTAILVAALTVFAIGCASRGGGVRATGDARREGKPAESVTFEFDASDPSRGTVRVEVFGEFFEGPYLQVKPNTPVAETRAIQESWAATWKAYNWNLHPDPWARGLRDARGWVSQNRDHVAAALRGKSQTMRCRIALRDPAKGLTSGGSGDCQISGGGEISLEIRS
jgi:hypothetical protein